MGIIYKITNDINNKIYIGQTKRTLARRWTEHKYYSQLSNQILYYAMRKYGIEHFNIEIIEDNIAENELSNKEIFYIEQLNSMIPNGYNMTVGGDGATIYNYEEIQDYWLNNQKLTNKELSIKFKCSTSTIAAALQTLPEYQEKNANKIVIQIDPQTNGVMGIYSSTRKAAEEFFNDVKFRSGILQCCEEKQKIAYGYYWHYLNTPEDKYFEKQDLRIKCLETNIIYISTSEASRQTGIDRKSINRCVLNQQKTAGGYHWQNLDSNKTIEDIEETRSGSPYAKKVRCIETGEIFNSVREAKRAYHADVQAYLAGRQKSAGKDKNGNKLHWEFIDN